MSITFGLAIDFRSARRRLDEQLDRVAALFTLAALRYTLGGYL